jgi:hypothetical protein
MNDSKPVTTPAAPHTNLSASQESESVDRTHYRAVIGSLQFLASCTRPDIAHSVSQLARFQADPRAPHLVAAKRVMRYLKNNPSRSINYSAGGDNTLTMYADASFASDTDTRRSTSGWVAMFNSGAIAWGSRRQPYVTTSSSEAEYAALATATAEAIHLRALLAEIGKPQLTTRIFEDNAACTFIARNHVTRSAARHWDVKLHFLRERVERGEIDVVYISTDHMLADMLTKALDRGRHEFLTATVHGETLRG